MKFVGVKEWFRFGVVRKIGDRRNSLFWKDRWVEGAGSLAVKL